MGRAGIVGQSDRIRLLIVGIGFVSKVYSI